jgi:hypothetical protein
MFPQIHSPGDLAASDFTHMNSLGITIGGQPFSHMLYHFTLTYSNWEFVTICFSESFEAFSRGLQAAFWQLGGVPRRHRSDSLTAAVNNLSADRDFQRRYRELLDYYRVQPERINARKAHENGDVESSHGHLKTVIDQALLLRGSRDFASREEYEGFLQGVIEKCNLGRAGRFAQEQLVLGELPPGKLDHRQYVSEIKVLRSSTIQVKRNTYSVPSRLIGREVDVVIDADVVQVLYAGELVQTMPRLLGSGKHEVNYRHVIDSLVRKPGAFENYQYREDMFPTSHFRMAYDELSRNHTPRVAAREYLKILQLAARDSEDAVQDALRLALKENQAIRFEMIRLSVERQLQVPPVTDVNIEPPNLKDFDSLLQYPDMEVDTYEYPCETESQSSAVAVTTDSGVEIPEANAPSGREPDEFPADAAIPGTATADVSGTLRAAGGAGNARDAESCGIPVGTDSPGMPGSPREPNCPSAAAVPTADRENVAEFRLDPSAPPGGSPDGKSSRRVVPGPPREPAGVWETRFGEEPLSLRVGRTACSAGTFGVLHTL